MDYYKQNKNSVFVKQAVGNMCTAITEHRWKDALTLLPSFVAMAQESVPKYFMWKVVHIVLVNNHVSQDSQKKMIEIMSSTGLTNSEIVIDMITNQFEHLNEENIEHLYQIAGQNFTSKETNNPLGIAVHGYRALWWYLEWKRHVQLGSIKQEFLKATTEMNKKSLKLGTKCFLLLKKAMSMCMYSGEDSTAGNEQDKTATLDCEWLLGPLVDVQESLERIEEASGRKTALSAVRCIDVVASNARSNPDHLPAWKLLYFYLNKYNEREEKMRGEALSRIVSLSPENELVLDYANHFSGDRERKRTQFGRVSESPCLLGKKDVGDLFRCLESLVHLVEFPMWRRDERAWGCVVSTLNLMDISWHSCWSCLDCEQSRGKLEDFISRELELWPRLFWNLSSLQQMMAAAPKVAVRVVYAGYMLGLDSETLQTLVDALKSKSFSKHAHEKEVLAAALKEKGDHFRDVRIFLGSLRSKNRKVVRPTSRQPQLEALTLLPAKKLKLKFDPAVKYCSPLILSESCPARLHRTKRPVVSHSDSGDSSDIDSDIPPSECSTETYWETQSTEVGGSGKRKASPQTQPLLKKIKTEIV